MGQYEHGRFDALLVGAGAVSVRAGVVLLLIAASALAHGQMFKWTDKDGKVHYTDKPPPAGAKQQPIKKPQQPPPSSGQARGSSRASKGSCADYDRQLAADVSRMQALASEYQQNRRNRDKQKDCALQRESVEASDRIIARMRAHIGSCGITQQEFSTLERQFSSSKSRYWQLCGSGNRR